MTAPSTAKTPAQPQQRDSTAAMPAPGPVKPRRNTRVMLLGAVLAVLCGLLAVWAVNRAGTPRSVVVVTNDVAAGDQVTKKDLGITQVNGGDDLSTVPADKLSSLVDRRANTALPAGSLANESAFVNRLTPRSGHVILGVLLSPGQYPDSGLQNGDSVRLVPTADAGAKAKTDAGDSISAIVLAVGKADSNGKLTVDLSVSNSDADAAAKAAGTEKVAILNVAPGGTGITPED